MSYGIIFECLRDKLRKLQFYQKRILSGGVCYKADDPRKIEYGIFVWEGTEAKSHHRAHAVAQAIQLDFLLSSHPVFSEVL